MVSNMITFKERQQISCIVKRIVVTYGAVDIVPA